VIAALPETPRWLVSRGKNEEALSILTRIYGDSHEAHIVQQYQVICDRRDHKEPTCLSSSEITDSRYRKPLLIAFLMQIFQQASGNSIIVYYSTLIFHALGYSPRDALLYNALACIPQFLVLVSVIFTLDKYGRKPALLTSEIGIITGLVMIGGATTITSINQRFWFFLIGIVIHRAFFAAGMGPVPGVLVAETLPFPIRGRALSLSLSLNWMCNFIVTVSFPMIVEKIHPSNVYWIFALIGVLGVLFIVMVVDETKGVSLEKIEQRAIDNGTPDVPELEFSITPGPEFHAGQSPIPGTPPEPRSPSGRPSTPIIAPKPRSLSGQPPIPTTSPSPPSSLR
jgi:hypothetical protein